jgi:hypothetical protein
MNQHAIIGCAMLLGLWSTSAVAQSTLGELLDAGGKKLSKEEVQKILSGAYVVGPSTSGATTEYDYKVNGSYSGNLRNADGWQTGVVGAWSVDGSGKVCAE